MYEIFVKLLQERGLTPYQVAKDTGISQTTFTRWKQKGTKLSMKNLKKLADYFDVSVEYLAEGTEAPNYYLTDETAEIAKDIFDNRELRLLFDTARDVSPEDLKLVHGILLKLKKGDEG